MNIEFNKFEKIPRFSRDCVITEKIDGTNAQIYIGENGEFLTGSRNRWITPKDDNFGFSKWAHENKEELLTLGVGRHFGEWWGQGILRNYGLKEKRFSLFNTGRWNEENKPKCCHVVPVLYAGMFGTNAPQECIDLLKENGSVASSGFDKPEGIIIYHIAGNLYFKKTILKDEMPKSFYDGVSIIDKVL